METKKAIASGDTLTMAKTETMAGSQSDFILAQHIWNSLVEIWGQEHGCTLQVKAKEGEQVA